MTEPRSRSQRRADVLNKLSAPVADAWVATTDGREAFLVPLTLAWWNERIVLATDANTPTARNIAASGRARLALGSTRDVVRIDATLERTLPVAESGAVGEAYAAQNDWDPREAGPAYAFLILRPERVEAWRELPELRDRVVMRDGAWLV